MNPQQLITYILELIGTVAFSASGAALAAKKKMDLLGVIVLGGVTAVGGGIMRDVIIGVIPPSAFVHGSYALVAAISAVVIFIWIYIHPDFIEKSNRPQYDRIMFIMDSIGLGIFTVVGVNTGFVHGYGRYTVLLAFLGTITGVGGGLLRDIMAGEPPYIFVKHIYACASIIGSIVCIYMQRSFGSIFAMISSSLVVIIIRCVSAKYRLNLPKIK